MSIFLIVFFVVVVIILIFAIAYNLSTPQLSSQAMLTSEQNIVQDAPTDLGFSSGSFILYCNEPNQLFNISSLTIPQNNYIITKDNEGFSFLKKGYYNFQISFIIAKHNDKGANFKAHSFISNTSSKDLTVYYNTVNSVVNGPNYLYINQISYCIGDEALPYYDRYYQKGEKDTGGTMPPLIVFGYPCKANESLDCYSNYYTFSGCMSVANLTDIYYIQFAHEPGGSIMSGSGNLYFQYINE